MKLIDKYKNFAPILLRIAISIVFLWFGLNQVINPQLFLNYIPQWLYPYPTWIIYGNGAFEVIFGFLLLTGLFTRISSFLLFVHLSGIAFNLGYNEIAVRDFGLAIATLSIFLYGPDRWSLDKKLKFFHYKWKK